MFYTHKTVEAPSPRQTATGAFSGRTATRSTAHPRLVAHRDVWRE
jgi:hypothetical protein